MHANSKAVFEAIGVTYRFMEDFPEKHSVCKEHLNAKQITSGKTALLSLSDNLPLEWCCHSDNLDHIFNFYQMLLSRLYHIFKESKKSVGTGLLVRIKQFKFAAALFFINAFHRVGML